MEARPESSTDLYRLSCRVDPFRDQWTLIEFLTHRFRYHPPDIWRDRLEAGAVRVNGELAAAEHVVGKGDRIEYEIEHREPDVDFRYEVLHEDDHVLAVNKSGNLPVHGGGKYIRNTLIAKLREKWGDELRLAHRLDRETSGVVLLAKSAASARGLEREFHARRVQKEYLAVLRGDAPGEWTVDAPIARAEPVGPPYFRVVADGGKESRTGFRRLARGTSPSGATISLVRVEPESGRTNQIRVHAAHVGHPVLGDKIYGVAPELAIRLVEEGEFPELLEAAGAPRQLLHCARLVVAHPATGEPWETTAPAPPDFCGHFPELASSVAQDR